MNRSRRNWALALTSVASLMVALDTLVVSTALTTIREDLGASIEQLEWTVNAYNLSLAVSLLPAAALGDRFGRRRLFAAGLAAFVLTSAACALAPDVNTLIIARAVQGVGAAFVISLALAIVSAAFPAERRGTAIGILEGVTGLATIGGPVIGGAIAAGLSWEWIFWVNVPIGALALPFVLARIGESRGPGGPLDLRGFALVTAGAFGVVWALVRGNSAGWGSLEVVGSLVLGVLLVVAFVAWELRAPAPMLAMRLFRARAFSGGNAVTFLLFAALFAAVFFFAQFLQSVMGYGPLEAGLRLVPWTATLFVVAPAAGALADRIGERPLVVTGMLLQASGLAWVALIAGPEVGYLELLPALVVTGVGCSMAIPTSANAVVGAVRAEEVGIAAGANGLLRELGGVFGVALAVALFAGVGGYASAQVFSDGFTAAILMAAGLSLAGAAAGLALPGRARANEMMQRV